MHAQGSFTPLQQCMSCMTIARQQLMVPSSGGDWITNTPSSSITYRVDTWDDPDGGVTPTHKLCVAIQDPLLPENLSIAQVWKSLCMEEACCHLLQRQAGPWLRVCHREMGRRKGFSRTLFLDSSPAIKKGLCFSLSRASTPTSCTHPPTACVLCFYYSCSLR